MVQAMKHFLKNISRLQRAEILSLEKNKIIIEKHHQLDSSKISPYKNIEEVQEAFSELFIRVIKEQSSDSKKIGSKLSGGIDSSSITSILCSETQNKIVSYSGIFTNLNKKDFELTDERKYMDSVIEKYNIEPRFVDIDTQKINPLAYLDDSNYSEVTPHANRYFEIIILEAAKKDNIDVLFDGFDGDSVLSYGYEYLNELGKNFNLITLINESKSINHQRTYLNIIKDHVIYPRISNDLLSFARFLRGKDPFQNRFKILNKNYKFIFQNQYNRHFGRKKYQKLMCKKCI